MWHFIYFFLFPFNVSCVFTFSFPHFFSPFFQVLSHSLKWRKKKKKIKLMAHNDCWIVNWKKKKWERNFIYFYQPSSHAKSRLPKKNLIWLYVAFLCNIFSILKCSITFFLEESSFSIEVFYTIDHNFFKIPQSLAIELKKKKKKLWLCFYIHLF